MTNHLTQQTYSVDEARALVGASRNTAYDEIRTTGKLAGVAIIRVGQKMIRVPKMPFDRMLRGEAA